jgi:3-isopropylmalate/(R)-2-methylmalate dehydratase small subunit
MGQTIAQLLETFPVHKTTVETDVDGRRITFSAVGLIKIIPFSISGFDAELISAGGRVRYADATF